MKYYDQIKENLLKCEIYDKVKDYSKNQNRVKVYFEIGKLLSEVGREYGKNIIKQYADKLKMEVGKKYNERTLYAMRRFYEKFKNEKLNPLGSKLSWTHFRELLALENIEEIRYYIGIAERDNLTKRELQTRIKSHEYDRLSNNTRKKLINKEQLKISDLVPEPIIIKNNSLINNISEYALKKLIIEDLDNFLKQLGSSYTYVGNEYPIKLGDRYNYIDLLLFNIEYNCYVVVELKVTELKKEHIGQIEVYMNYIDNNLKRINHNKTIGIIIVRENNDYIIKYSSDERIIAREYMVI